MRNFEPWIGDRYRTEGLSGIRVLILGESHYSKNKIENSDYTINVVRKYGTERRDRFLTMTQKLVEGIDVHKWIADRERIRFWERVAFYNFVQAIVGPGPRFRPSPEMWAAAATPFLLTVQELDPQVLVVLGKELGTYVPRVPFTVHTCCVNHPSSRGFRYEQWQPVIRKAMQEAGAESSAEHPRERENG